MGEETHGGTQGEQQAAHGSALGAGQPLGPGLRERLFKLCLDSPFVMRVHADGLVQAGQGVGDQHQSPGDSQRRAEGTDPVGEGAESLPSMGPVAHLDPTATGEHRLAGALLGQFPPRKVTLVQGRQILDLHPNEPAFRLPNRADGGEVAGEPLWGKVYPGVGLREGGVPASHGSHILIGMATRKRWGNPLQMGRMIYQLTSVSLKQDAARPAC